MTSRRPAYKAVALGGTFDLFHKGHEQLLENAFGLGAIVLIGIISDKFVKTLRKTHPIQPYKSRLQEIRRFLRKHGWTNRARTAPLMDSYGPAAKRKNLEALIVTADTLGSGRKLNLARKRSGLPPLIIEQVQLTKAEDGKPICSTRIRNGEIDRRGRLLR